MGSSTDDGGGSAGGGLGDGDLLPLFLKTAARRERKWGMTDDESAKNGR